MKHIQVAHTGKLLPPVQDILVAVLEEYGVEELSTYKPGVDLPVLSLGQDLKPAPKHYIKSQSQKQIMNTDGGLTKLRAGIDLLLYPPTFAPMKFTLIELGESALPYFKRYHKSGAVVVDIETGGDIETMLPSETWLLSVALNDGKEIIVLSEEWLADERNKSDLYHFLTSGVKLIAHNMKFDFRTLSAQLGFGPIKGHFDTQLLHHAMRPGSGQHDLKGLCELYLGAEDWDDRAKEFVKGKYKTKPAGYPQELWDSYGPGTAVGYEAIPRHILYPYNAYDVYWTLHLKDYLLDRATPEDIAVAKHEYRMSRFFQDVEGKGAGIDRDKLDKLEVDLTLDLAVKLADLQEMTWDNFNPGSHVQVKRFLAEAGVPLTSSDEDHLMEAYPTMTVAGKKFVDALLEYRGVAKSLSTYVLGIKKRMHNGRAHPSFLVHGTKTGRLSSQNPNIQNIPRDATYRNLITTVDPEERTIVEVDYSQAELRVMACLSEDEYLISLFQPGMPDFFDSLMPVAFPDVDLASLSGAEKKDLRANLKGVIYGLSYGRKARAIAKALDMPVKDAQAILDNYLKAAPQFNRWRQWVEDTAMDPEGILRTPIGRHFQSDVVSSSNRQNVINSALSFLPQSTASDMCVVAAMRTHEWLGQYDAWIIATVHDAILIDCPKIYAKLVSERVQDEMMRAGDEVFHGVVPFATEAEIVPSWGWKAPKIDG